MLQFMPSAIMFIFTVAFASLFLIPATSYSPKNTVVGFYWKGVWGFFSIICAVAGAAQSLAMLGFPTEKLSDHFLQILLVALVFFVVFGWFRLAGKAAFYGARKIFSKV